MVILTFEKVIEFNAKAQRIKKDAKTSYFYKTTGVPLRLASPLCVLSKRSERALKISARTCFN
jgi:hypothetical protein